MRIAFRRWILIVVLPLAFAVKSPLAIAVLADDTPAVSADEVAATSDAATRPRWQPGRLAGPPLRGESTGQGTAAQPLATRRPPTYRGQTLKLPALPFARSGAAKGSPAATARRPASTATPGGPEARPQAGASAPLVAYGANAPLVAATANRANPDKIPPAGGSDRIVGDRPAAMPAMDGPQLSPPNDPTRAAETRTAGEPQSPADRLVLSAHQSAAAAETEEDFSRIIETCRRARASQPSQPVGRYANELAAWSMNRRGQLKAQTGRMDQALLDFEEAVRLDPRCWRAWHNCGVLRAQAGQFERAFDDFNRTIQISPEFAKAYSNRAALLVVAGDLMPALVDYDQAIALDSDLAVAHRGRGRVSHLLGRLDEAIGHYDAAVQLAPDDAYAVASRADVLTDMGRYVEASEQYEQAMQLDPNSAHAQRSSAWLLATCPDDAVRDADKAIERAKRAIELDGQMDSLSYDTLAAAQANAGDFQSAEATLRQAIDVAADNEREVYLSRLQLYQRSQPYRIAPVRNVSHASFEAGRR